MIKLYLDEDVTYVLAQALRQRGFDATSALELGNTEWKDEDHLEYAVSEGRTVLTYNIADFVHIHRKWQTLGKEHYGIVLNEFNRLHFGCGTWAKRGPDYRPLYLYGSFGRGEKFPKADRCVWYTTYRSAFLLREWNASMTSCPYAPMTL